MRKKRRRRNRRKRERGKKRKNWSNNCEINAFGSTYFRQLHFQLSSVSLKHNIGFTFCFIRLFQVFAVIDALLLQCFNAKLEKLWTQLLAGSLACQQCSVPPQQTLKPCGLQQMLLLLKLIETLWTIFHSLFQEQMSTRVFIKTWILGSSTNCC